ncbi:hypothetical protein DAPPUDRAFT_320430 [Daphnia pulex]|uniref:Uncharacterized protein n=1 Tax=Daphnia pulex TaxID=6669 RepID=E9GPU1_DAPPU|nr:hypothetical protein DAPPUDRAFT_320430 [Daphnia pulex]|eukprot:EFX78529.1 hypothetical protein DAPPUDRAFT_320430 [Daphnia pulex]
MKGIYDFDYKHHFLGTQEGEDGKLFIISYLSLPKCYSSVAEKNVVVIRTRVTHSQALTCKPANPWAALHPSWLGTVCIHTDLVFEKDSPFFQFTVTGVFVIVTAFIPLLIPFFKTCNCQCQTTVKKLLKTVAAALVAAAAATKKSPEVATPANNAAKAGAALVQLLTASLASGAQPAPAAIFLKSLQELFVE